MQNQRQMSCLLIHFSGRVQGVGFRYSVRSIARDFPVTGFVKNLRNGNVEVCAEGEQNDLIAFCKSIEQSRLSRYIIETKQEWHPYKGVFNAFTVSD